MKGSNALEPGERRALRARAHALKPVVWIADEEITPSVLSEIDRALCAHELIKVQTAGADREIRARLIDDVCARLDAAPVQLIGKVMVVYRKRQDQVAPTLPAGARRRPGPRPPRRTKRSFQGDR